MGTGLPDVTCHGHRDSWLKRLGHHPDKVLNLSPAKLSEDSYRKPSNEEHCPKDPSPHHVTLDQRNKRMFNLRVLSPRYCAACA